MKKLSRIFLAAALAVTAGASSAEPGIYSFQVSHIKSGSVGGAEISASRNFEIRSVGVEKAFVGLGKAGDQRWAKLGVGFKPVSVLGVDISAKAGIAHTDLNFKKVVFGNSIYCANCQIIAPYVADSSKKQASAFVGFALTKALSQNFSIVAEVTHFDQFANGPQESTKGRDLFGLGLKVKF